MALSKEERALLQNVRTLIGNGNETFICLALLDVSLTRQGDLIEMRRFAEAKKTFHAAARLRSYIMFMLQGDASLVSWSERRKLPTTECALRAARLAWIDWMLGE